MQHQLYDKTSHCLVIYIPSILSSCKVPDVEETALLPVTTGEFDEPMLLPLTLPLSPSLPESLPVPPPSFPPAEAILLVVVILTGTLKYEPFTV